jgi:hypothetical protein
MISPAFRNRTVASIALTLLVLLSGQVTAFAEPLVVEWLTQYCNEDIQTVDLSTNSRMLRNISNSLMIAAPEYLDDAIYLQRRTEFFSRCPDLEGIGEPSCEWLRSDRVSISDAAIVVAAVREDIFPGAEELLTSLGWTPLGATITLDYVTGDELIPLYAGLIPAGSVYISGAGVNALRTDPDPRESSHYFLFLETSALPAEQLALLNSVAIPEASTFMLTGIGLMSFVIGVCVPRNRRSNR